MIHAYPVYLKQGWIQCVSSVSVFRCRFAPSYFLFLSFFPRDLYPVDSCTVFIGHLRTLEHVMWSVAPTRLDHCLSPMHSESTWFTSVRSLAETDSPGRAQTGTRLAASPGVSDTTRVSCQALSSCQAPSRQPDSPTARQCPTVPDSARQLDSA